VFEKKNFILIDLKTDSHQCNSHR